MERKLGSIVTAASPALPLAHLVLRTLVVANWIFGAGILAILIGSFDESFIIAALKLGPAPDNTRLIMGLRAVAILGLAGIPLHYVILKRLLAIVLTVRAGDPFVATNAQRLRTIAWTLLAIQLLSIVIGSIGNRISSPAHEIYLDAGFSVSGWLAVILVFLLARVFTEGAHMREDLEGTV